MAKTGWVAVGRCEGRRCLVEGCNFPVKGSQTSVKSRQNLYIYEQCSAVHIYYDIAL